MGNLRKIGEKINSQWCNYCVLCGKDIFYPLNHWLLGTNICFKCNTHGRLLTWLRNLIHYRVCKHRWILYGAIVHNEGEKPIELTWQCSKCLNYRTGSTLPYDGIWGDELPSNLWEAIHWHKYEVIAMTYERHRLRQAGDWEMADILRNEINRWDFNVADMGNCRLSNRPKDFTLIRRYPNYTEIPDRNVSIPELIKMCQTRKFEVG